LSSDSPSLSSRPGIYLSVALGKKPQYIYELIASKR
jgi:hypothetical protein